MTIMKRSDSTKWVKMGFDVPCLDIENEYNAVKDSLVIHRPEDGHKDWFAMTLYGVNAQSTNSHWEYGRSSKKEITSIGELCPKTMAFVSSLPYARIDDVRYLVIKAGGYIAEHVDVPEHNWLDPLNISITYPKGSKFIHDGEEIPYAPGVPIVLNIHYPHSVENNSNEDRLHLLIHGKKKNEFWNYVEELRL